MSGLGECVVACLVGIGVGVPLGLGIFALGVHLFVPPKRPVHWRPYRGGDRR